MKRNMIAVIAVALIAFLAFSPYAEANPLAQNLGRSVRAARGIGASSSGRIVSSALGRRTPSYSRAPGSSASRLRAPSYTRGIGNNTSRPHAAPYSRVRDSVASTLRTPSYSRGRDSRVTGLPMGNQSGRSADRGGTRGPGHNSPLLSDGAQGYGREALLNALRNYGEYGGAGYGGIPRGGWNQPYQYEDSMARAYRDVGIAQAVVGLVGIMVSASQHAQYTNAAPAYGAQPTPVPQQPRQYVQYQEWIPELYDQYTGQKIGGGYYETRTRLAP